MTVYDCVLHSGELDALKIRLQTLDDVVDHIVVIEVAEQSTGEPWISPLRSRWHELAPWTKKLRNVVVTAPQVTKLTQRARRLARDLVASEFAPFEQAGRGLLDIAPGDTVVFSEVRNIPDTDWVRRVAATRDVTTETFVVRAQSETQSIAPDSGNAEFGGIAVRYGSGALVRPSIKLAAAKRRFKKTQRGIEVGVRVTSSSREAELPEAPHDQDRRPVIICAYLHDEDAQTVTANFGLEDERGSRLPFFLWQDTERIGPERAFEHCWNQFPGQDVIIVHPDMRPLPDDPANHWYEALIASVAQLPDAGIVGADLLFPHYTDSGHWACQSVGGRIRNGEISHIHGKKRNYDDRYARVRRTDWATFGGVYIRREVIDMVGSFDSRYKWAYVMDVDYCMETQLRGMRIYQTPVNLIHEENGTTRSFLAEAEYKQKVEANMDAFYDKWRPLFRSAKSSGARASESNYLPKFPGG